MAKGKSKKKSSSGKKSILLFIIVIGLGIGLLWLYQIYKDVYKPNVVIDEGKETYLYIRTGSSYQDVIKTLKDNNYVKDTASFNWLAKKMDYPNHVKPGRYLIKDDMSNRKLINELRAGLQKPVKLVFNNIRTTNQLASVISKQIEADSISLMKIFNSKTKTEDYGFSKEAFIAMFIPNTYEFYWNTSAEDFCDRMLKEYKKFWNETRRAKAEQIEFNPVEITIIASIVEEETQYTPEKPIIAGVYINRLHRGMALQADPTVKFAVGDFTIKRVLDKHTAILSPYNTYRQPGLPPGPICIPSISSINAVLNYKQHEYLYFCAKEDFSGSHTFAKTLQQHNLNADAYRRALNKRKIFN
ncbi:MAG TPA: endolytic transglycosylase MltG [Bacteroidales bacterium]|nr:endolytic transglycosylase MltG [Bacteroidales bacterium]